jgi:hypothetical protein
VERHTRNDASGRPAFASVELPSRLPCHRAAALPDVWRPFASEVTRTTRCCYQSGGLVKTWRSR